jgi:hypothetical protein
MGSRWWRSLSGQDTHLSLRKLFLDNQYYEDILTQGSQMHTICCGHNEVQNAPNTDGVSASKLLNHDLISQLQCTALKFLLALIIPKNSSIANMKNRHFLLYPQNVPTIGNMIADKDDHQDLHLRYMRTAYH